LAETPFLLFEKRYKAKNQFFNEVEDL
ncbi:MAG: hypothetical protein UX30_C0012G0009, partial [Candidatus Saccharibacteria bacterium GW2011_GWA2_46_10]